MGFLAVKFHENHFVRGTAPDPTVGAYDAPLCRVNQLVIRQITSPHCQSLSMSMALDLPSAPQPVDPQ